MLISTMRMASMRGFGGSAIMRCGTSPAEDETSMTAANDLMVRRTLEAAGIHFIDEDGGGPGVRLRKSRRQARRK